MIPRPSFCDGGQDMTNSHEQAGFSQILNLRQIDEGAWEGPPGPGIGGRLFGGHAIAQALMAASLAENETRLAHSLHANFLQLGYSDRTTRFEVKTITQGRSFARRRVEAWQGELHVLTMSVSFHIEESGFSHSISPPDVDPVQTALRNMERWEAAQDEIDGMPILGRLEERPVEVAPLDVEGFFGSVAREPQSAVWMRARDPAPVDPALARAQLAYASDMLFLRNALLPHSVRPGDRTMQVSSLDHAIWFHETPAFGEWHLHSGRSPWAGHARGLNQGHFFDQEGKVVATVAQENLMRQHSR